MKKFLTAIKNKIIKLGVNPTPEIISTPKQVSLWRRWTWINQAVYNPLSPDYHYGQNLEIGFRDFNDFDNYIRTHLGEPQGEFKYLNRIDQTKGWIPGNLRWANGKQMGSNHPNYNINIMNYFSKLLIYLLIKWTNKCTTNLGLFATIY